MNDELKLDGRSEKIEAESQSAGEPAISDHQAQMALETFQSEQNLMMGTLAGLIATVTSAAAWAAVTVMTEYQIGWLAVGIGVFVGFAVRYAGRGIDQTFGIAGGLMSLAGCVLGNIFTITYFVAVNEQLAFMDILTQLNTGIIIEMLTTTFQVVDVLFYGLAAYFGYKYAFRQITEEDFDRALGKAI